MKKAFVHLANGFEEIEAITIVDVLRRAAVDVTMVSISGSLQVIGAHQIKITADCLFEDADYPSAEVLILPGGMPGSKHLQEHQALGRQLTNFARQGKYVAAICAAPMVLGGLDLLEGKNAVCYPGFENTLTGASVKYDAACVAGNIITGRGPGTALYFSLKVVEQLQGRDRANQLAQAMLVADWA